MYFKFVFIMFIILLVSFYPRMQSMKDCFHDADSYSKKSHISVSSTQDISQKVNLLN